MFAYVMGLITLAAFANGQCNVHIQSQLNQKEPLFLRSDELWAPDGPSLQWQAGKASMIACPGNRILNTGNETAYIRCVSGTTFALGASNVQWPAI